MAEFAADSVLVTISLDLPESDVRGEAVVTGGETLPSEIAWPRERRPSHLSPRQQSPHSPLPESTAT
ncbi:MAG: hypothetical protein JNL67_00615 [Planctomycetaceae bacterium]|nr:hypothetical protein [Planctomycetaceae bacterium]